MYITAFVYIDTLQVALFLGTYLNIFYGLDLSNIFFYKSCIYF